MQHSNSPQSRVDQTGRSRGTTSDGRDAVCLATSGIRAKGRGSLAPVQPPRGTHRPDHGTCPLLTQSRHASLRVPRTRGNGRVASGVGASCSQPRGLRSRACRRAVRRCVHRRSSSSSASRGWSLVSARGDRSSRPGLCGNPLIKSFSGQRLSSAHVICRPAERVRH